MRELGEQWVRVGDATTFSTGKTWAVSCRLQNCKEKSAVAIAAECAMGNPVKGLVELHLTARVNGKRLGFRKGLDMMVRVGKLREGQTCQMRHQQSHSDSTYHERPHDRRIYLRFFKLAKKPSFSAKNEGDEKGRHGTLFHGMVF
jgi:hypothetical protein